MRRLALAVLVPIGLAGCGERPGEAAPGGNPKSGEVLIAVNRGDNRVIDAVENTGRFAVVGHCLQLEVEGVRYTPIFFGPARYDSKTELVIQGQQRFPLGATLSVGGAPGRLSPPHLEIDPAVRAACPDRYFVMGSLAPLSQGPKPPPVSPPKPGRH